MYKYYYELEYFPIPETHEKKYIKIDAKGQSPKIKTKIAEGIYEIEDNHLFYTTSYDEYNVLVYTFTLSNNPIIKVQVTRYKKIRTSTYSLCVKSTEIIPNVSVIKLPFNTDLLKPVTFDINKYGRIDDPAFLVKKDGTTIDLVSINSKLYTLNSNYAIEIGELKSDESNVGFFAKGELMIDKSQHGIDKSKNSKIFIFDVFIINGEPLDFPYKSRMEKANPIIKTIVLNKNSYIQSIELSQVHDNFENAYTESQNIPNDGIIIQGPFDEPLKWKPGKTTTIDVLVEDDLYLTKGLDQILTFKVVRNPSFNMKLIWEYRNKYLGEIIEIGIDGSFHKVRYDKLKPNAIRTYKSTLEQSNIIDKSTMIGDDKLLDYIFNSYKEIILDKYVHGETIEINVDCGIINKINLILNEENISSIGPIRQSNFNTCKIEHTINKKIDEYIESENEPFDTYILELPNDQTKIDFKFLLNSFKKLLKDCSKIVLFDTSNQRENLLELIKKHDDIEILEVFKLSEIPNKNSFPKSIIKSLENYNAIIIRKVNIKLKPDFIFVVGLMGSGKSRLIDQIRNFVHPSTSLNIINTDNDVAKYISYQLFANNDTYKKIRKIVDIINDEKIKKLIELKQSILLETTHIDETYAIEIAKSHKTIAIICNTNLSQIQANIIVRNRVNIRQTDINQDRYDKFQNEIATYPKFIDSVFNFDMRSSNEIVNKLNQVKGGEFIPVLLEDNNNLISSEDDDIIIDL